MGRLMSQGDLLSAKLSLLSLFNQINSSSVCLLCLSLCLMRWGLYSPWDWIYLTFSKFKMMSAVRNVFSNLARWPCSAPSCCWKRRFRRRAGANSLAASVLTHSQLTLSPALRLYSVIRGSMSALFSSSVLPVGLNSLSSVIKTPQTFILISR